MWNENITKDKNTTTNTSLSISSNYHYQRRLKKNPELNLFYYILLN